MAKERNSEGKASALFIASAIVTGLAVIGDKLLGGGVFSDWPTVTTIVGLFLAGAKLLGDYSLSRPGKHAQLNEAARIALAKTDPS